MRSVIFAAIADGFLAQKQSAVLLLFNRDKRSGVPAFSDADIERNGDTAFGGDKSVCFHFGFLLSVFFDLDYIVRSRPWLGKSPPIKAARVRVSPIKFG